MVSLVSNNNIKDPVTNSENLTHPRTPLLVKVFDCAKAALAFLSASVVSSMRNVSIGNTKPRSWAVAVVSITVATIALAYLYISKKNEKAAIAQEINQILNTGKEFTKETSDSVIEMLSQRVISDSEREKLTNHLAQLVIDSTISPIPPGLKDSIKFLGKCKDLNDEQKLKLSKKLLAILSCEAIKFKMCSKETELTHDQKEEINKLDVEVGNFRKELIDNNQLESVSKELENLEQILDKLFEVLEKQ